MKSLLLVPFILVLTGCWDTGDGNKIGQITKLAKQGVFCQTWEGSIQRGGLNGGTGVVGAAFDFTVESDELAKKVQDLMNRQVEVKVFYRTELNTFCRSDSMDHFLTGIEIQKPTEDEPKVSKADQEVSSSFKPVLEGKSSSGLDRQKTADAIVKQNGEVLRQNQQLIDLLKVNK